MIPEGTEGLISSESSRRVKTRRRGVVERLGPDRWSIRWFVGRSTDGKRLYQRRALTGTKRAAERELAVELRRVEGGYMDPGDLTVESLIGEWLAAKEVSRKVTARTLSDYRYQAEKYVVPFVGQVKVRALRLDHVQALVNSLAGEGKASETVRKAYRVLHSALAYAVTQRRLLPSNPAAGIELPQREQREMLALGLEEASAFMKAIIGNRHEALLGFLLGTGCRPSEAFALAWRDLDLERATVTIRRRVERVRTELRILEGTKTNGGRRTLRLATALVNALRAHRGRQAQTILEAGPRYDRDADLVFANDVGGLLDPRNVVNRYFKPALARAGLSSEMRLYDLRHSHATLLLHRGVNVKAVSARLGHASAAMTLDRYAHALPAAESQAIAALDAVLGG
jgi:integrase